jgi:secretion/DNA translocation related TadE-like protein
VIAAGLLVLFVAYAGGVRVASVLARHRTEAAADLAALAAAGQIGVGDQPCAAARAIAAANHVALAACAVALAVDGRSGTVRVQVRGSAHLPIVGRREVVAAARAARLAPSAGGVR